MEGSRSILTTWESLRAPKSRHVGVFAFRLHLKKRSLQPGLNQSPWAQWHNALATEPLWRVCLACVASWLTVCFQPTRACSKHELDKTENPTPSLAVFKRGKNLLTINFFFFAPWTSHQPTQQGGGGNHVQSGLQQPLVCKKSCPSGHNSYFGSSGTNSIPGRDTFQTPA